MIIGSGSINSNHDENVQKRELLSDSSYHFRNNYR